MQLLNQVTGVINRNTVSDPSQKRESERSENKDCVSDISTSKYNNFNNPNNPDNPDRDRDTQSEIISLKPKPLSNSPNSPDSPDSPDSPEKPSSQIEAKKDVNTNPSNLSNLKSNLPPKVKIKNVKNQGIHIFI